MTAIDTYEVESMVRGYHVYRIDGNYLLHRLVGSCDGGRGTTVASELSGFGSTELGLLK